MSSDDAREVPPPGDERGRDSTVEPQPVVKLHVETPQSWAVCRTCGVLRTEANADAVRNLVIHHVLNTGHRATWTRAQDVHYWRD